MTYSEFSKIVSIISDSITRISYFKVVSRFIEKTNKLRWSNLPT